MNWEKGKFPNEPRSHLTNFPTKILQVTNDNQQRNIYRKWNSKQSMMSDSKRMDDSLFLFPQIYSLA